LRALEAELADLPATVQPACDDAGDDLGARIDRARVAAAYNNADAAVWLTRDGDDRLLFFLDPAEDAARVRRVEGEAASAQASLDAAAVITRSSLDALLRERNGKRNTTPLHEPSEPPTATPPPPPPPPPWQSPMQGRLRLLIGYTGSRYAPEFPWISGLDLAASYLWPSGGYIGAGYLVTSQLTLPRYNLGAGNLISATVNRRPISLQGGYQRLWPLGAKVRLGFEGEFGVTLDITAANTSRAYCLEDGVVTTCETMYRLDRYDPLLFNLGFTPRMRLLLEPARAVLLYLGVGLDAFADQTIYATCADDNPPGCRDGLLLDPYNLRPIGQAGLIFRI
ncbi:MAG: hypothetical protein KC486_22125, partial [Myxococcales bacterium]|nr:hypothetical protein [Myxococcales bacterium]